MNAVGSHQHVAARFAAVNEATPHIAIRRHFGVRQSFSMHETHAAPARLFVKNTVQICPLEGVSDRAVLESPANGDVPACVARRDR